MSRSALTGEVSLASSEAISRAEGRHTSGLYHKRGPVIVSGRGAKLKDADGKEYIDCIAGHGVANVGHANPVVAKAISAQAHTLVTCPESFHNDSRAEFLSKLAGLMPPTLDRFFLCNSGTEAIEGAIKFARLSTGRKQVIATKRGFHGRTLGALSATWDPKYREPFVPLVPGFGHVPYNDVEALEKALGPETAAVIVEPVQGEGGVHVPDSSYLSSVQDLCHKNGSLLILDEVQTGFGRTGKMFGMEHFAVVPDILCMAKGIAGGVPMGAIAFGSRVGSLARGVHASTFGGNPLACAAGSASLAYLTEMNLPKRAAVLGEHFKNRLCQISSPLIREVRGLGLLVGVELKKKVAPYLEALMGRGVLALPAGVTVIRFLPPLVIEQQDLDIVASQLEAVLGKEL